jgi:hypothetical protein
MKLLTNSENLEAAILTRTLHRNPPVVLKYHTGSHLEDVNLPRFFLHTMRLGQRRKLTIVRERSQYVMLPDQFLE